MSSSSSPRELCSFRLRKGDENVSLPPRYSYVKNLIPVVLDLNKIQYTCWSTLFRQAARAYDLLHHIDPTISLTTPHDHHTSSALWCQQDAVVLTWIYATISPYLLIQLVTPEHPATAMDAWARLRDICQQYDTFMQKKKRRFIHIDLNEDINYDHVDDDRVDLISDLPDDVLIHVLSLADDIKTAGRTSLMSKRWTNVWTHIKNLDFSDPETNLKSISVPYAQPLMDKFVDFVNRVLSANRAPYLSTLRINFPLNTYYAPHIHNWLNFAFTQPVVHNLNLNFRVTLPRIHFSNIFSINPALVLNTTLVSLNLNSVSIKGPLLQWVLTNCLALQYLTLNYCRDTTGDITKYVASSSKHPQKVLVVSSLKLKHLEFHHSLKFLGIDALHLSAPNLTTFIFYEGCVDVEYGSVPSLVDATFEESYISHDLDTGLSGFSSQIEKLSIRFWEVRDECSALVTFVNVQRLEILFENLFRHDDLLLLTSFIKACPLLNTFKLKLTHRRNQQKWMREILPPKAAQVLAIRSHQHLKVVVYVGYAGCQSAAGLALCLTQHAPMLQRFIIDTRPPRFLGEVFPLDYTDPMVIVTETKTLAERIQGSQGLVDVVII